VLTRDHIGNITSASVLKVTTTVTLTSIGIINQG